MLFSELQNKSLVNIIDGRNIGNIVDIKIDEVSGNILSLSIDGGKRGFSFRNKSEVEEIKWSSIKKIGEDVILVDNI